MFENVTNNLEGMLSGAVENYVGKTSGIDDDQDKGFLKVSDGPPDLNASIGDYVSGQMGSILSGDSNISSTA